MKFTFSLLFLVVVRSLVWGQALRLVVPIGHTENISSVAFSPDGKHILTGGGDGMTKLWNLDGKEIMSITFLEGVGPVAFSPDGKLILTGGNEGMAKLWNLEGKEIHSFNGHSGWVRTVAFSPNGKLVLTGSQDKTAILWKVTGQKICTLNGHLKWVNAVAFSPDGNYILTGSDDNTSILWDMEGNKIQIFINGPRGPFMRINAVSFSPDGKYVLTGSHENVAKLWNLAGKEIKVFKGHSGSITSVDFSPNGKYVLTGSRDETAKLWDFTGKEIRSFIGHIDEIETVAFSPDGEFVLTGAGFLDGSAKLWNINGQEIQSFKGHSSNITTLSFSPDGNSILTGTENNSAKLFNIRTNEIKSFGFEGPINSANFSHDGKLILASDWDRNIKIFSIEGKEVLSVNNNFASAPLVDFSPDSKTFLAAGYTTIKLYDLSGKEIYAFKGHSESITSIVFSPDGKYILSGSEDETARLWNLAGQEVLSLEVKEAVSSIAFSPDGKYVLTGSEYKSAELWDRAGKMIRSFKGSSSEVVRISPDGKDCLIVDSDKIRRWNLLGKEIHSFKADNNYFLTSCFSPDGKYIVSGSSDNTFKIWDAKIAKELITVVLLDSTDWVVTTPSGLFDASPGAMKLMHYVKGLEVIELEQLKERYYEPGLLAKIMGFDKGELRNVAAFDNVALYPEIKAGIEKDLLNITLTERSGGLGKLSLFINNKEVQEDINPKRLKTLAIDLNSFAKYYRTETDNTIALRAYNKDGWLKSQAYELTYRPAGAKGTDNPGATTAKPASNIKPRFYALIVGTSNYAGERLDLRFADHDAAAMSQALQQAGSALFGAERTVVTLLSTAGKTPAENSNKTNIAKAFADMAAKATPADVLVVYFSGHGLAYGDAEKAQFYYLTKDIGSEDLSDPVIRNSYTISSDELTRWLTDIPAQKQVMILDACNAGKVVESLLAAVQKELSPSQIRALDRMKDRTGMFILTGSAADKVSYEAGQYGQGLLTYSLLQGMSGLALTEDKRVDVMTLFQYSRDKVPELAKGIGGIQTPVLAFPTDGSSFDIGIVNDPGNIPLALVKPLFIRNNFTNEDSFDDDIRLTDALENYFREITAKGAQAELIFVDVKEYENAYSMKGHYTVKGDVVALRGRLFKGTAAQGEFQVTGKKSDLPELAELIVEQISNMIK